MTAVGVALLVALLVVGAWSIARGVIGYARWVYSVYQYLFTRPWRVFSRPAGGSSTAVPPSKAGPAVDRHEGPVAEQPDAYLTSQGRHLSSPLPARCTADLESAAVLAFLPIGAIDPAPDLGAFAAGVELVIFTTLFTIMTFLVVNWIVKTMRGSDQR